MTLQAITPAPGQTLTLAGGATIHNGDVVSVSSAVAAELVRAGRAITVTGTSAEPVESVIDPVSRDRPGVSRRGLVAIGSGLLLASDTVALGASPGASALPATLPAGAALVATDAEGHPRKVALGANLAMDGNVLSATGTLQADLSTSVAHATGTPVPYRLGDYMGLTVYPEMFGAKGDCVLTGDSTAIVSGTDDGPAIQRAIDFLGARGGQIHFGPKNYLIRTTAVIRNAAIHMVGSGYAERAGPAGGTFFVQDTTPAGRHLFQVGDVITSRTPASFQPSEAARGTSFRDMAFYQIQPASVGGWKPADYPHVLGCHNMPGGVRMDNLFFCGITRGILLDSVGHPEIGDIKGQWYTNAMTVTNCEDTPSLRWLRHWGYREATDHNVQAWQRDNLDVLLLGRVDGIMIDNLFGFGCRSVVHCYQEPAVTGAAHPVLNRDGGCAQGSILNLQSDHCSWPLWFDNLDNRGSPLIWNVTEFVGDCVGTIQSDGSNTSPPAGHYAIWIDNCREYLELAVASFRGQYLHGEAVHISGTTNLVRFGLFSTTTTNFGKADPPPAVIVVEDNTALITGPHARGMQNEVAFGTPPHLFVTNGGALIDARGNAVTSSVTYYLDSVALPKVSAPVRYPAFDIRHLPDPGRYEGQQIEVYGLPAPSHYGNLAYSDNFQNAWCWLGTDVPVSQAQSPEHLAFLDVGVSSGTQRIGGVFTKVHLPRVASDSGSNYNPTTSTYTVRWSGAYRITTRLRLTDDSPGGVSYGQGAGGALEDGISFEWFVTAPANRTGSRIVRNSALNSRDVHLNAGEEIFMIAYVDSASTTLTILMAEMTVSLLARS